jgi:uncharacterized metal-binding protein
MRWSKKNPGRNREELLNNQNSGPKSNSPKCDCEIEKVVAFLCCSGSSNCGQIANQAAISLTREGAGRMYCLAGIGAHHEGMIESAKSADRIVALDGCPTACAKKTIEHAGITVTDWVCVTESGIKKVHNFDIKKKEVEMIVKLTRELLSKNSSMI